MIGWIIILVTMGIYLSATVANEMYRKHRSNDGQD